ncbi:MAG: nitronate monooxygenase [Chloroflexota bacterium]
MRITKLLGIKYPIIQSGMNYAAYPILVAAVSNAGGLGILGAGAMSKDELRQNIRTIRTLTDKPFGVNFLATSPALDELIQVLIEEKVPVACYGRGDPQKIIERTKAHGIINLPTVGAVKHAMKVESYGADAVIVQGMEGGGHTGYISTLVLIPQVVASVKVPVIAAGGFCDGKGLVAALALGAEGIAMGTRFALTKESTVPDKIKQAYLSAEGDDAVITAQVTGTRCRGLNNKLVKTVEGQKQGLSLKENISTLLDITREFNVPLWKVVFSGLKMKRAYEMHASQMTNVLAGRERIKKALVDGDTEWGFMPCGQVCSRIRDIPTCQEIIERVMSEATEIVPALASRLQT